MNFSFLSLEKAARGTARTEELAWSFCGNGKNGGGGGKSQKILDGAMIVGVYVYGWKGERGEEEGENFLYICQ